MYIRGNLVTWNSKQQSVSGPTVEVEHRAMTHTICEMMWLKSLLWELGYSVDGPMPMYCDN